MILHCPVCGDPLTRKLKRTRRTAAQIAERIPVHVVAAERRRAAPWVCPTGTEEHKRDFDTSRHRGGEVAWGSVDIERRHREFLPPDHPDRLPWMFARAATSARGESPPPSP